MGIRWLAGRGRVGLGQLTVSLTPSSLPGSARPWGPHIPGEAPGTSAPPIAGVTSQQSHKGTEPWIEARFICLVLWAHIPAWSSGALEVGRSRGSPRVSHQPCLPSRRVSRAAENQRPHSGGHLPGSPVVPRSSRTAGREGNVTLAVPRTCPKIFLPTAASGAEARGRVSRPNGTERPRHHPMSQVRVLRPAEAEPTVRGDRARPPGSLGLTTVLPPLSGWAAGVGHYAPACGLEGSGGSGQGLTFPAERPNCGKLGEAGAGRLGKALCGKGAIQDNN